VSGDGISPENDPTRMRNQPALQTSTGAIWLGLGAVMTIIVLAVLGALLTVHTVISALGMALVSVLFVSLVVTRFVTPPGRGRLRTMASLFGAIAFVGLATVFVVSSIPAESLG
jgi:hypothetical protein